MFSQRFQESGSGFGRRRPPRLCELASTRSTGGLIDVCP